MSAGVLLLIGLMSLYSIDRGGDSGYFRSQATKIVIGIVPAVAMFLVHPKWLQRRSSIIYALSLICLMLVFLAGRSAKGAQRWIDFGPIEFQPSELAKFFLAITLAAFFANRIGEAKSLKTYLLSLAHLGIPLLLVLKQPHLGGALSLLIIWLGISLVAGTPPKFLAATVAATFAILLTGYYTNVLPDYQLKRVKEFVMGSQNKDADSRFHQQRALISFGSGGISGQGYLKGEHKGTGFVPEQQTDYISTVIGEEGGLIGCTLLLGAFAFFLYRVWLVMFQAVDPFMKLAAAGILSYLAFHTVANLGMNLELLPVVGLWLPFMSFGGTALWLCMASVALVLNIRGREPSGMFEG
jgi:rod shape determining protein RodA